MRELEKQSPLYVDLHVSCVSKGYGLDGHGLNGLGRRRSDSSGGRRGQIRVFSMPIDGGF
jgi:hypothetical protein